MVGCSREQCILLFLFSRQEAIYVAVPMYLLMLALYFPRQGAIYTGTSFVMPSRQAGCTVAPFPRAGSNSCRRTPAAVPSKTGSVRSPLFPNAGSNCVKDSSCVAGCSRKQCILSLYCFLEAGSNLCSSTHVFPDGSPLFSEAVSNTYRHTFCYPKQTGGLHSRTQTTSTGQQEHSQQGRQDRLPAGEEIGS